MAALGLHQEIWLDEFGRALCRCYEMATRNAGKQRWADKSPENAVNVTHWDRLLQGRMVFILVVRHPFDVICSMHEARMDKVIATDIQGRAAHVARYLDSGLQFASQHPERSIVLRYEDLIRAPAEQLRRLLRQLGEHYDDAMLTNLGSDFHGIGLQDPKARHRNTVSNEGLDRWHRDLSLPDAAKARPILAALSAKLGYSLEPTLGRSEAR
jgi:hypothetical protein